MSKIIVIANQKGGVGKTTAATNIAAALKMKGFHVLIIDTDPQCNASDTYQANINGSSTLYDVLVDGASVSESIQHLAIDILPSDPQLSQAEYLLNKTGKEYILKKSLKSVISLYDYIIIDTPPTLGVLLINALTCADEVIVPITADRYSLQGLAQLQETIVAAQEYTNPDLKISGLLLTKFNDRTVLSRQVANDMPEIAKNLKTIIFETKIHESIAAREAQAMRVNLYDHAPKSTTAIDYLNFVDEFIRRV